MAIFKETRLVRPSASTAFDRNFGPGETAPFDGIYRCTGCNLETLTAGGRTLPTAAKLAHPAWCKGVRWQLLVAPSAKPTPDA